MVTGTKLPRVVVFEVRRLDAGTSPVRCNQLRPAASVEPAPAKPKGISMRKLEPDTIFTEANRRSNDFAWGLLPLDSEAAR